MSKFKEVYLSQMKTCYKSVFISRNILFDKIIQINWLIFYYI